MHILLTNDDGITAAGLANLFVAAQGLATTLSIVAPDAERSGAGLAVTWNAPFTLSPVDWPGAQAWSVAGTPADCVKMALNVLLPTNPDLVLSGVNLGDNSGKTALYSGTVGGAIEAALRNIPSIAFSFSDLVFPPAEATRAPIATLIRYFLQHPFPPGTLLNINFPHRFPEMKGYRMARQGRGYWAENPRPEGARYWLGEKWNAFEEHPQSDVALLQAGFAAITPIHIADLTDEEMLERHKAAIAGL